MMPDIKAEVNVDKEREKKGGGLLGFLSRLSGGGGGASGAAGGMGGLGGAAAGGGLLATKAGLIGLVLAGTTVAGGLGMVGWTAFGPGQGDRADSPSLQLFASKPKEAANPFGAVAPVASDGASASLNYLAKANGSQSDPAASSDAPVTEQSAASATEGDATAASAQSATPHMGESVGTSGTAPRTGLKDVKKLGELSKSFGGGGGSGGASASAGRVNTGADATVSNAASKGSLGAGFGQRSAGQSIGRGLARARGGSATRQAMNALGDNRRAFSSQAGGRTYDGGAASGGTTGVDAGLPGAGGPGLTSGGQQPTSTPNTAAQKNEFEAPPTPKSKNVTPWQKALNIAMGLILGAGMLLMIANMLLKASDTSPVSKGMIAFVKVLAAIAAAMSLAAIALGGMISGGKYGQPLQGGLIAVAGVAMGANALIFLRAISGATPDSLKAGQSTAKALAGIDKWMMVIGGAGMVAMAGAFLSKPKSYPSSEFDGKKVPDLGYHVRPEERSRYTA